MVLGVILASFEVSSSAVTTGTRRASDLDVSAGWLCLDFANTADWHRSAHPVEHLTSYAELVVWSEHAAILTGDESQRLMAEAGHRPGEADAVLARALVLREAIYHIFSAVAGSGQPRARDLDVLNQELVVALSHTRVVAVASGFTWAWIVQDDALDRMLWPIARSAADLLTSDMSGLVRECADELCGWLFVDKSRNHSRHWCSMQECGNRNKAQRFYARARAE
jgi:predicted RNA-binding Zn ribbon-like protein